MAYRIDWSMRVSWVPPGQGLGQQAYGIIGVDGGPAQSVTIFGSGSTSLPNSNTFTNTDVANMLTTINTDATAQLENAALQTRIQNFSTGTG